MKSCFLLMILLNLGNIVRAQSDSLFLLQLNQSIDDLVVKRDTLSLQRHYAGDFVFSHGSGRIEGKAGWMKSVAKGNFQLRKHDSVAVELHPALAILRGKLSVHKQNKEKIDRYHLKYIRVYALRDKEWWLISHVTTAEWHE